MRLMLQVLFLQGYLWRNRFPEVFSPEIHLRGDRRSVPMFLLGLPFLAAGAVWAYYGSPLFAGASLLAGAGFTVGNIGLLRVDRLFGSAAFWVSLSWAWGAVALFGVVLFLVISGLHGSWICFSLLLAYMALPGTITLLAIQSRYLFFADPERNAHRLELNITGVRDFWFHTYWRLPKEILFPERTRPHVY